VNRTPWAVQLPGVTPTTRENWVPVDKLAISSGTKNLAEAKRRANEQWAKWETELPSLRIAAPVEPSGAIEIDAALADEVATR
jgi:hypothetical protein